MLSCRDIPSRGMQMESKSRTNNLYITISFYWATLIGNAGKWNMELLIKLRYNINIVMKLNVQYRYESEIKKSNNAFTIIQNYSTSCYIISYFWLILIGNGGKQDIKFFWKKLHYFYILILLWCDTFSVGKYKRNQKV